MAGRNQSLIILLVEAIACGLLAGCDVSPAVPVKPIAPSSPRWKVQRSEQEWVLSDQSRLKAIYEEITSEDANIGAANWIVRRTPAGSPLKSLEFSLIDPGKEGTNPKWLAASPRKDIKSVEEYSLGEGIVGSGRDGIIGADPLMQIALRVQAGEEPEILSPLWIISPFAKE